VFINPAVASLPEHAHLLGGDGCYEGGGSDCKGTDALPARFLPVLSDAELAKDARLAALMKAVEKKTKATFEPRYAMSIIHEVLSDDSLNIPPRAMSTG
jgi:hypothetical protein